MVDISTIFNNAADVIFDNLGVTAIFTPVGGDAVSCSVDLRDTIEFQPNNFDGQIFAHLRTIEGRTIELGQEPNRNDTFTVDGTTYVVQGIVEADGQFVKVWVK